LNPEPGIWNAAQRPNAPQALPLGVLIELRIDHQCPQCGAPAVLEDGDRLYRCDFCKVPSCLLPRGVARYVLPHQAPADRDLAYVPYWRFKGTLFTCGADGIRHRFTDESHCAVAGSAFPPSLGLRSQALRLKFVTPATAGRFLEPVGGPRQALDFFTQRQASRQPPPVYLQTGVGESLSLIYTPVYRREGRLYDGVLNRVLAGGAEAPPLETYPGGPAGDHLRFVPALCPACGRDLEGRRDTLVLLCRHCDRLWRATPKGLEEIRTAAVPMPGHADRYLPFWRIRARVEGIPLASFADLARLANLPAALKPDWSSRPLRFWAPAFKVRAATLLHLGRALTLAQPPVEPLEKLPRQELLPVTLPVAEAVDSLTVLLATLGRPARRVYPRLSAVRILPRSAHLAFIPFSIGFHEYLQPGLKLAVNKKQLALAGHL
jgi:ribosomal protein L37AE/L43A